ncbi:dihydrodipicolinate reductase [Treponema primitia ZAS-2]|uniref:4-hydroxy-tetrahydrodipicolinate reductase n=1 Tax=Treponema primitia (strain ATCC BAA-887 / DSM 12427 / ZAS-2) TaxID=545694 RepID=F5YNK8_TREPZ|nr:dihydrodipicolinate reductase C-terminal domain-containing protein [Treponema primitia]AEF83772.1 dihydrodipicolinate reductase [Treponema primitia ZAS-2]
MNIALIGYGKMGRILERTALERGHTITVALDPAAPGPTASGAPLYKAIAEAKELGGTDVAVEFTRPDTAAGNIAALIERGIPTVAGTTGWYDKLPEIEKLVNAKGASLCWSSNYSLGVNLFYRIAALAAKLADPFPEYDVGGWEFHHNKKVDSPSGTAKILVGKVLQAMTRKKKAVWEKLDRPPEPDEIHFPSLRLGSVPGLHALSFDSPSDTIEISHSARNRDGLALGAIRAAEWLLDCKPGKAAGKARNGVFTFDDVMEDILKETLV